MPKTDQFTDLYHAAAHVLEEAIEREEVYAESIMDEGEENDYPCDANGRYWFSDWWELKLAVEACDKLIEDDHA